MSCRKVVVGKLTHVASWGLSALQALILRDSLEAGPPKHVRAIRNLPARVYCGVNSDAADSLRLLGVPRGLAAPLATAHSITPVDPLDHVRAKLRAATPETIAFPALSRPRAGPLLRARGGSRATDPDESQGRRPNPASEIRRLVQPSSEPRVEAETSGDSPLTGDHPNTGLDHALRAKYAGLEAIKHRLNL
jgi:hypothetical protein